MGFYDGDTPANESGVGYDYEGGGGHGGVTNQTWGGPGTFPVSSGYDGPGPPGGYDGPGPPGGYDGPGPPGGYDGPGPPGGYDGPAGGTEGIGAGLESTGEAGRGRGQGGGGGGTGADVVDAALTTAISQSVFQQNVAAAFSPFNMLSQNMPRTGYAGTPRERTDANPGSLYGAKRGVVDAAPTSTIGAVLSAMFGTSLFGPGGLALGKVGQKAPGLYELMRGPDRSKLSAAELEALDATPQRVDSTIPYSGGYIDPYEGDALSEGGNTFNPFEPGGPGNLFSPPIQQVAQTNPFLQRIGSYISPEDIFR